MRLRLNSKNVLEPHTEDETMAWVLVKMIDEEQLLVEVDARVAYSTPAMAEMPHPEERWTLIEQIRPGYLAGATVEVIEPDRGGWKVKLIETLRPLPRNAQFARTFTVRKKHLASRA